MSSEQGGVIDDASIAIIGYAVRFPGAKNLEEFWQNLRDGVESISFFSDADLEAEGYSRSLLAHPACVKAGAILDDIELFDAPFFGYSPMDAAIIDPQQRLFLECAWEALENAGYDAIAYDGLIGVFGGVGRNAYLLNIYSHPSLIESSVAQITIGNCTDYLTTRVSYKLNLRGPSVNVQTACSTSLVAIHMACQSILNAECNMAVAGGMSLNIPQKSAHIYQEGGISSPDGHCHAYDARAKGIVGGSGGGIVVLKRLADALAEGDCVHAVIKGSAINNDGAAKVGFTAPSVEGQADAISEALAVAGVKPETIGYVEGHGTGTVLGDPIEVAALTQAFRSGTEKKKFCALGSVKTNFGHLDTGAGVAGVLKTTLALKHHTLPPSLNFERPNPEIDFANSPFYVNASLKKWESNGSPRRAGVSSFGLGGTNAHVILEEAPTAAEDARELRPWSLILLSAKTASALETSTTNLSAHLRQHPHLELADVAYTLQVGRRAFNHRRSVVCNDIASAVTILTSRDPKQVSSHVHDSGEHQVLFMFSGQGAQYVDAGKGLYETEPVFRKEIDRCAELLAPHLKADLRATLYPSTAIDEAEEKLNRTEFTQPTLFALEYALARLWMHWGVNPQALIGHSIGEYVAACLAGVFSLEEAVALVAARGRLMQSLPGGAMLSVALAADETRSLLGERLSLAAVNADGLCVVSGCVEAIEELQTQLLERGITNRRLHTSHAFHSEMMDPIMEPFAELVKKVNLRKPRIPFISNVTGDWISGREATDPYYWVRHLRQTVLFSDGLRHFTSDPQWIFLEVGPGNTLSSFAQRAATKNQPALSSLRHPRQSTPDAAFILGNLGRLWMSGANVAWSKFNDGVKHYRVPLPTYPFERKRHWIERQKSLVSNSGEVRAQTQEPIAMTAVVDPMQPQTFSGAQRSLAQSVAGIWQRRLGIAQIGVHENFYELGGDSLLATQIVAELREMFHIELTLNQFFQGQTIADLAQCIEEILVAEVSQLSDAEAQQQLAAH